MHASRNLDGRGSAHAILRSAALLACALGAAPAMAGGLHYVVNAGDRHAEAAEVGFNLADVGSVASLDALPDGMRGVLWLGNGYNTACTWRLDGDAIREAAAAARAHPRFSGIYYISDEPHPATCPDAPQKVAERTALIHSVDPDAKVFILVQNGWNGRDEFRLLADSADLIGVNPYPCTYRNAEAGCDLGALRERIEAALEAGIAPSRIVPVFQAFGQDCAGKTEPYYRMPEVEEMEAMLRIWDEMVPKDVRVFDMTYSWAPREGSACPTLALADGSEAPDLLSLFHDYFAGSGPFSVAAQIDD